MGTPFDAALALLRRPGPVAVITGAGMSAESGLHTFRGAGGLWTRYDVEEVATAGALRRNPRGVWEFFLLLRAEVARARPNPGHRALAALEGAGRDVRIITQNVDGLHQAAGSRRVLEIHGNVRTARSERTGRVLPLEDLDLSTLPPRAPDTGELLRPNVLYFEELYDPEVLATAREWVAAAAVILVVGTSGMVSTPYVLAAEGRARGIPVVDVNLEAPGWSGVDVFLRGAAGQVLPRLVGALLDREIPPVGEDEDGPRGGEEGLGKHG